MQEAFGQALAYSSTIEPPPPFIIVTDIGYCFDLYAAFDGTRNYRKFPDALSSRINIESLERDSRNVELLRAIFTDPHALDPSKRAVRVTREIAGHLANVARSLGESGHDPEIVTFGRMVTPEQFHGIEIKEWAKEITELVLWIGWLQWQIRTRGYKNHPEEPILRDYHNIELRDAVLAYDRKEPLLDDHGDPVTRWDGETMKVHPVTGEEVPDESACAPVYRYVNPRKAEWPEAEFVVGNPPFVGTKRMRAVLGDGYADALRSAYSRSVEEEGHLTRHELPRIFAHLRPQTVAEIHSGTSR